MKRLSGGQLLGIISTVIIVLSVFAAVIIIDPPGLQRHRRLDERRISDLWNISESIDTYWERKNSLPPNLSTLHMEPGLSIPLKDPETGLPYDYEITGVKSYRLCAVFSLDSADESREYDLSRRWSHGAGRQCFELTLSDREAEKYDR